MGSRPYYKESVRDKTRKQRKASWIHVKNLMRKWPECAFNGDFYCDHASIVDGDHGTVWADFRFFHTKQKRYYAVAMITCEMEAWDKCEDWAWDLATQLYPWELDNEESCDEFLDSLNKPNNRWNSEIAVARRELAKKHETVYLNTPYKVTPKIVVKDYGPVAIGLWVTINKEEIDANTIREFISFFRSLGEPTKPGWTWKGDEVEVIPQEIRTRDEARRSKCGTDSSS